jgi:hypothetical protein
MGYIPPDAKWYLADIVEETPAELSYRREENVSAPGLRRLISAKEDLGVFRPIDATC